MRKPGAIKYLTVYAFSTENWNRPDSEVAALMKLLRNYMKTCLKTAAKNDMKIRVIGDIEPLDDDIKNRIRELEEATVNNGRRTEFHHRPQLRKPGRDHPGGQEAGCGLRGGKSERGRDQ